MYEYLLLLLLYSSFTTGCEGRQSKGWAGSLVTPGPGPQSAQYLCGGLDEPVLLSQGGDDGDVAHRLVGVFLVLVTQSRKLPLESYANQVPPQAFSHCHPLPCKEVPGRS